jgi:hypothetical protein
MRLAPHISLGKGTIALIVAILGALTLAVSALATGSHAGQNTSPTSGNAPTIVATCAGTHVWAVVNSNGTLARHGGACIGTSSSGSGSYDVLFPKNIVNCAYIVTVGSSGRNGTVAPGYATVVGAAGTTNGVFVQTFNSSGILTAMGFHLVVDC